MEREKEEGTVRFPGRRLTRRLVTLISMRMKQHKSPFDAELWCYGPVDTSSDDKNGDIIWEIDKLPSVQGWMKASIASFGRFSMRFCAA
jgi:hypothetical protein